MGQEGAALSLLYAALFGSENYKFEMKKTVGGELERSELNRHL